MEKRPLGKTGMNVTALGFGCAEIGFEKIEQQIVGQMLNEALDEGLNIIDTAECYLESETKIGDAVSHRRKDFFLFTKTGHKTGLEGEDWDPAMMEKGIERSLKRLKTDCLDLLQIHSCTKELLIKGDVLRVVEKALAAGKTRFIGFSGDGDTALHAIHMGLFSTLQTSVNIADQEAVSLTIPEAARRQMGVIAKRPLANVAWRYATRPNGVYGEQYWDRLQELKYPFLAAGEDADIAAALNFTTSVPGLTTAIMGTSKAGQWKKNMQTLANLKLGQKEYQAVRERWKQIARNDWVGLT